jgi:hypothetical protein
MTTRQDVEQQAWQVIASQKIKSGPRGLDVTGRPANYRELGEALKTKNWELAWGDFLHEFYAFRDASFFFEEPPVQLSPTYRVLLAGVAEYLCKKFEMPCPEWVEKSDYFLDELRDWHEELVPEPELTQLREEHKAQSDPAFIRRNLIFPVRALICL